MEEEKLCCDDLHHNHQTASTPHFMSSTTPLAGGVAIVTGASSGIGRCIALTLAKAGCSVALAARRLPLLESLKTEILAACPTVKVVCVATDVSVRSQVQGLVDTAESELGPVTIMVNCAGVMYFTLMKNCVMDEWDKTIDINIKGVTNGFGSILPKFLERKVGHIITISSDAGRRVFRNSDNNNPTRRR
jgi:NADP-dependent 3-hydroxy acid dehydrogenase YdfG